MKYHYKALKLTNIDVQFSSLIILILFSFIIFRYTLFVVKVVSECKSCLNDAQIFQSKIISCQAWGFEANTRLSFKLNRIITFRMKIKESSQN